jgi:saccharopine dehydrogenase (NAD+, L-lysine-forming)
VTTVAVLGAAGTIGPAIVRDLAEGDGVGRLVLLDRAADRVEAVAAAHGGGQAKAEVVDAADPAGLAAALQAAGASVLVNAASYRLNLSAMEGALGAGCHYVDLGGLYHTTRRQLGLHDRFAAAGLTAVLGLGASPGKTNLLAAWAAAQLDEVRALHVSAAATDPTPPGHTGLSAPYALETILDELTLPAVVLRDGQAGEVPALADGGDVEFPPPIGRRRSVYTLHSELATFPDTFPGLRESSFRLSLAPALAERVELLARCGLADLDPLDVDGVTVTPRSVLLACVARRGAAVPPSNRTDRGAPGGRRGRRPGPPRHGPGQCGDRPARPVGPGRWRPSRPPPPPPRRPPSRARRGGGHRRARPGAGLRGRAVPRRARRHRVHRHVQQAGLTRRRYHPAPQRPRADGRERCDPH